MAFFQKILRESEYKMLIDKHKDMAYNIALKITRNGSDSEEIVQDSFVKAFEGLDGFKKESQFSTWFYRIVYNTAITAVRRKKIDTGTITDYMCDTMENDQIENALDKLDELDRKLLIEKSLAKLNELEYTVLSLYYFEELGIKEISEVIGENRGYIKVVLSRSRLKLLNNLSESLKRNLRSYHKTTVTFIRDVIKGASA